MKKIKFLLVMMAASLFFAACNNDDETKLLNPTVEFISSSATNYYSADATVDSGSVVNVIVLANKGKDGAKLKEYKVTAVLGVNSIPTTQVTNSMDETLRDTIVALITQDETLTFTVTDKDGKTGSKTIKFTKRTATAVVTPKSLNGTVVNKASFDLEGNVGQPGATAPATPGDFDVYYFHSNATGGNFVVAGQQKNDSLYTQAATWIGSTNALIKLSSSADFTAAATADEAGLATMYNNATDLPAISGSNMGVNSRVTGLAAGQVYAVRTSSNKYALVKVKTADNTACSFDFLIQN